jgi:hypothetical protein
MTDNTENNILMSFWINRQIKKNFVIACKANNSSMTAEINRFIRSYIAQNKDVIEQRTNMFGEVIDSRFFGSADDDNDDVDSGW